MQLNVDRGRPYPMGATVLSGGINFAVFSQHAQSVTLELFDTADAVRPYAQVRLNPRQHRTGDVWHAHIAGLRSGQLYGFRMDGPYRPTEGHRFNASKLLLDPYAKAVVGRYDTAHAAVYGYDPAHPDGTDSFNTLDSAGHTAKSVALADDFDWQGVRPPRTPLSETVLYEVHVRGLTVHPSSPAKAKGTYAGVVEMIPHFKALGITALELLPVHEFDRAEPAGFDPETGEALHNYWGYSTLGFFAPEQAYGSERSAHAEVVEFKTMVRELHRAGIEVILDVVFNHTGEGSQRGPTLSFRGLDNSVYYMLDEQGRYKNYSGCGNTVNCNHPVVKRLIIDSLRYWAVEMGVDGFRFDLATILGRDRRGAWIDSDNSLLYDIGGDPILRGTKLIAESWDAHGMYKVGGFPDGWAEWNGRYRDDLRRFLRGDHGLVKDIARRIGGSRDLFGRKSEPAHSVNFITCHDGFTLRDLFSYRHKHNANNGENNRDGSDINHSHNFGVEGETTDPSIRAARRQQAKNAVALLMVSRGTPMLLGGDELWRTKHGNNNTYNQNNARAWFDWTQRPEQGEIQRFHERMVRLRHQLSGLRRDRFADPDSPDGRDIQWHGIRLGEPDYSHHSHSLAFHVRADPQNASERDVYVAINMWTQPLEFILPGGIVWSRVVDTSQPCPEDIVELDEAVPVQRSTYTVPGRTVVLLIRRT